MAPDDFVEALRHRLAVERPTQAYRQRRIVGSAVRFQLRKEPQPLLRETGGKDVRVRWSRGRRRRAGDEYVGFHLSTC